jgi:hypothetical protein
MFVLVFLKDRNIEIKFHVTVVTVMTFDLSFIKLAQK